METIRCVEKSLTLNHGQMTGENVLRPCYDFWTSYRTVKTNHSTEFSCKVPEERKEKDLPKLSSETECCYTWNELLTNYSNSDARFFDVVGPMYNPLYSQRMLCSMLYDMSVSSTGTPNLGLARLLLLFSKVQFEPHTKSRKLGLYIPWNWFNIQMSSWNKNSNSLGFNLRFAVHSELATLVPSAVLGIYTQRSFPSSCAANIN